MGYDITFHSISRSELQHYFFDVLENPACAETRSKEISDETDKQNKVLNVFYKDHLIKWYEDAQADYQLKSNDIADSFSFVAAILSGYLHPYHYSRNFSISLLTDEYPQAKSFFTSLTAFEKSPLFDFKDEWGGVISHSYAGSGVIKEPKIVLEFIKENNEVLVSKYSQDEISAITKCLEYCITNDLYFMEAAEVVFPLGDSCYSDMDNFQAYFLSEKPVTDDTPNPPPVEAYHSSQVIESKPWWAFWR
jgi:hypothetical protein